jgi:hemerythrin-like domain-containing protein
MKATDLLKNQHREVEDLLQRLEMAEDERERSTLREELANALTSHNAIEEEIFYPAMMQALGPSGRVREAFEEHTVADFALYRLLQTNPQDETFSAKLQVLKELVMNHVEEEEGELLPQAEGEMDRERLDELGTRLEAAFEQRMQEGHRSILAQSLGLAQQTAQRAPGAKKAAAPRRGAAATTKRRAAPQKRAAAPQKRGGAAAGKRAAAPAAKRATPAARGQKSTTARGQGAAARGQGTAARGQGTAARGQGTAARGQGTAARGQGARGQGAARTQNGGRAQKAQPSRGQGAAAPRKRGGAAR